VAWLRQKLEDDPKRPQWIMTVHGLGYKFLG
jgi:DNA-binding response OmpR family regulator